MKTKGTALVAMAIAILLSLQAAFVLAAEPDPERKAEHALQQTTEARLSAIEGAIEEVIQSITSQPTREVPPRTREIPQAPQATAAELTNKRLEAAAQSLRNIAAVLASKRSATNRSATMSLISTDCGSVGCNCRFVRECVYVTCCQWGAPPSDPGTVKCMKQCCGAWESRFVCD